MNALGDDLVHATTAFLLARQGPWGTTWEVAHEAASLRTVDRRFYGLLQQFYIKMGFASHAELVQAVTKDKDTRITKSRAKEEYHLTDKELNSIPCLLCRNPVFGSAAAMKLYQLVAVVRHAEYKWGSRPNMKSTLAVLEERRKKRQDNKEARENKRRAELVDALRRRGLVLRHDSRMCDDFISKNKRKLDEVVDTMDEMNFFHKHTNYRDCYDQERRLRQEYYDRYVIEEVSEEAKAVAMRTFTKSFLGTEPPAYLPRSLHRDFYHIKGVPRP